MINNKNKTSNYDKISLYIFFLNTVSLKFKSQNNNIK